jgi:hypothetical protein
MPSATAASTSSQAARPTAGTHPGPGSSRKTTSTRRNDTYPIARTAQATIRCPATAAVRKETMRAKKMGPRGYPSAT